MSDKTESKADKDKPGASGGADQGKAKVLPKELGGRKGPEPTRYGDWEKNGIISDF
ncbi:MULTISPECIES: DUF1674 domain-containing protein [Kordiimonas]|jgi:hypothetical protein|uniref:DUF1674 domain-containing protein n=1 Tax=Kordiimonas TaxID=288021 RepID=UPI00257E824E|nr:DUF1674 domain-containing protein [Kordiimonas sp. UBA4487]